MKKFFILCVVLVARVNAEFVSLILKEYEEVVDACRNETGYTDELVAKEKESFFSENRGLRILNYCYLEKTGLTTKDGKLNTGYNLTAPSLLKDIVDHCKSREEEFPEVSFSKCFHNGVAVNMRFSEFYNFIKAKNITKIVDACRMETNYTDEVLVEEEKTDLKKDAGLKKFNSCFLEKTGFVTYAQFYIDDAITLLPRRDFREIIEHCRSKIVEQNNSDSTLFLSACLHLGVSKYIRSTEVKHSYPAGESIYVVQIVKDCQAETGFTDEVVNKNEKDRGFKFSELKGLRKFNDCFLNKTGFITSDGRLNIDATLAKFPSSFAKPIVEHCQFISPYPMQYDQVVDPCRNETSYTDEVYDEEKASYFAETKGLRKLNYCFLEKTGFATRDGKLNIDDAVAKLGPSDFRFTLDQCNKHAREKLHSKSIFSRCFHSVLSFYLRSAQFIEVTKSQRGNITNIVNACLMETGYTDEVIAEEEKSDLKKDAGLKKFNKCFLEKTGFTDNDKFDIDNVLPNLPLSYKTEMIEFCESKILQKKIPDSVPFLSACLHLGVSSYFRSNFHTYAICPETDHVTHIVDVCQKETGFTDEALYKEKNGNFTEETGLRKFNNCFLQKTDVITSDGKLNIDAALAKFPPSFTRNIIEHCQANIILKYTTDSVHDFSTCYLHGVQSQMWYNLKNPLTVSLQLFVPGTSFAKNVFIWNDAFLGVATKHNDYSF